MLMLKQKKDLKKEKGTLPGHNISRFEGSISLVQMRSIAGDMENSISAVHPTICSCDGGCPVCADAIQPRLKVGSPNDKYEREANQIADEVLRMPQPVIQRAPT